MVYCAPSLRIIGSIYINHFETPTHLYFVGHNQKKDTHTLDLAVTLISRSLRWLWHTFMAQTCCKYSPFLLKISMRFLFSLKQHVKPHCFSLRRLILNTFGTEKSTSKIYRKPSCRAAFHSLHVSCCTVPLFKVDV